MKQLRRIGLLVAFIVVVLFSSCTKSGVEPRSQSFLMLGTVCRITIYDKPSDAAFKAAFERIKEIEEHMSIHMDESEISRVNRSAGRAAVPVSEDTFLVVQKALEIARLSGGAFDPTVGPLVEAWGIGGESPRRPSDEEIAHLLTLVGYDRVIIDEEEQTIFLSDTGMVLDLGAIAKGYAADEAARVLTEHGVGSAIVNLGGNVLTVGLKVDGSLWRIGIQDPEQERGGYALIAELDGTSLVTSGPYERFFTLEGEIYHHILDTTTGYPVVNEIISASIITESSFLADALSTTLYALGVEEGMALMESLEGVEAILLTADHRLLTTSGVPELTITDARYHR